MKPTKALILFLAPLALAACSSDPEWADPEAHEKTMELQERYAPLLVGTWHVEPDKYDFDRGHEYRIAKEFFKLGQNNPKSVYCYFTIE